MKSGQAGFSGASCATRDSANTVVLVAYVMRTCGRRPLIVGLTCVMVTVILGAIAACGGGGGGGGGGGTPSGTYTITISGQSGSFNHSSPGAQLVVH